MKKTKLMLAIAASLIAVTPFSAQASDLNTETTPQVTTLPNSGLVLPPLPSKDPDTFTPLDTQVAVNKSKITSNGGNFTVPAGFGWLKIWVKNTGSSTLTVTVRKPENNTTYLSYQVNAGQQIVIPNNGKATGVGLHLINFSSKDGVLSGDFSVVMANNPGESQR